VSDAMWALAVVTSVLTICMIRDVLRDVSGK
jgi:hypothetical protein